MSSRTNWTNSNRRRRVAEANGHWAQQRRLDNESLYHQMVNVRKLTIEEVRERLYADLVKKGKIKPQ